MPVRIPRWILSRRTGSAIEVPTSAEIADGGGGGIAATNWLGYTVVLDATANSTVFTNEVLTTEDFWWGDKSNDGPAPFSHDLVGADEGPENENKLLILSGLYIETVTAYATASDGTDLTLDLVGGDSNTQSRFPFLAHNVGTDRITAHGTRQFLVSETAGEDWYYQSLINSGATPIADVTISTSIIKLA